MKIAILTKRNTGPAERERERVSYGLLLQEQGGAAQDAPKKDVWFDAETRCS